MHAFDLLVESAKMSPNIDNSAKSKATKENSTTRVKAQPWRAFISEPETQPFSSNENGANTVVRLKTEKDEHGLGG